MRNESLRDKQTEEKEEANLKIIYIMYIQENNKKTHSGKKDIYKSKQSSKP